MTQARRDAAAARRGARAHRGGRRGQDVRLRRAARRWGDDVQVGTRVRAPFHGRTVRGWVVDEDVGDAGRRRRPAPQVVAGLGTAAGPGASGGVGGLALGRAGLVLPPQSRRRRPSCATLPAPPAPTAPAAAPSAARAGWTLDLAQAGRHRRAPAAADRSDRLVLSVVGDPAVRARAGSVLVLVPSSGWAERLAARLERRGCPTAGALGAGRAGLAGRGRQPGRRLGPACPGWRPRSSSMRTTRPTGRRARPPTARSTSLVERARRAGVPCILASPVPAGGAGRPAPGCGRWRRRGPRSGRAGPSWNGSTAAAPTRAAACSPRSSSAWPGPSSTMPTARERGPLVCVYNRTGGARLLACRHCGELARCARCGAAAAQPRGEEVLRCPRCDETRPVVCAACGRLRMKTAAGRREPAARGTGGAARGRGGGGGRPAGGRARSRRVPTPPS